MGDIKDELKTRAVNVKEDLSNLLTDLKSQYELTDKNLGELQLLLADVRLDLLRLADAFTLKKGD